MGAEGPGRRTIDFWRATTNEKLVWLAARPPEQDGYLALVAFLWPQDDLEEGAVI